MRWVVAALLAAALLAGSCSGTEEVVVAEPTPPPAATEPTFAPSTTAPALLLDVAPDLEFFGDLAELRSGPVSAEFDGAGGSLVVSGAVTVEVPAGAFSQPTELRVAEIDLTLDRYATDAPGVTLYRLSTRDDVALAAPVTLEIDRASAEVRIFELVDGRSRPREIPDGPTTRVEIVEFSDVTIAAVERIDNAPQVKDADPRGPAAAEFLGTCIIVLADMLSSSDADSRFEDESEITIDAFSLNLAYSLCAKALVAKYSPAGVNVEVSCVGDRIGGDVDLFQAIDGCAGEQTGAESVDEPAPEPTADSADPAEPVDPPGSGVPPSLIAVDSEVTFAGCPDPNFPNVCQYSFAVTLDYVTPVVPSTLRCKTGLLEQAERSVTDQSGTATVTMVYSVLRGSARFDALEEVTARCELVPAGGGGTFTPVFVDVVGETPDDE